MPASPSRSAGRRRRRGAQRSDDASSSLESVSCVWVWSTMCHIVVFEAPFAALEGVVRGLFNLCFGAMTLSSHRIRESIYFFAGAISFALPFVASTTVYSDFFDPIRRQEDTSGDARSLWEDEWHLLPLPTLIGAADPRRFWSVSRGHGGYAINCRSRAQLCTDMDHPCVARTLLLPPESALRQRIPHGAPDDDDDETEGVELT